MFWNRTALLPSNNHSTLLSFFPSLASVAAYTALSQGELFWFISFYVRAAHCGSRTRRFRQRRAQLSILSRTAAGASLLTSSQQDQAAYAKNFYEVHDEKTLGTVLPSGSDTESVIKNWQDDMVKAGEGGNSWGLAFVSGFKLKPICDLVSGPNALEQLNQALRTYGKKAVVGKQKMSVTAELLAGVIAKSCNRRKLACDVSNKTRILPGALPVTISEDTRKFGAGSGGVQFYANPVGIQGMPSLTYSIRPVKLETWWRATQNSGTNILSGFRITYADADGKRKTGNAVGTLEGDTCSIDIGLDKRVEAVNIRAGAWIDYIRLYDAKYVELGSCGNANGGTDVIINSKSSDAYFVGFSGKAGGDVDSLFVTWAVLGNS